MNESGNFLVVSFVRAGFYLDKRLGRVLEWGWGG